MALRGGTVELKERIPLYRCIKEMDEGEVV